MSARTSVESKLTLAFLDDAAQLTLHFSDLDSRGLDVASLRIYEHADDPEPRILVGWEVAFVDDERLVLRATPAGAPLPFAPGTELLVSVGYRGETLWSRPAAARAETPYKGLMPYSEDDALFFFGRDVWRDTLIDNLKAYRLTVFYGESGVGKTSVLRAGVAHHLRRSSDDAVVVFSAWRDDPVAGLSRALRAATTDVVGHATARAMQADDLAAVIDECAKRIGGRLFVILDQFEEYFLYRGREAGEGTFAAALPRVIDRRDLRANFIISIREDALAKLDRFKSRIPNLLDNLLRIEHLDREEATEAIHGPVARWNELRAAPDESVRIEDGLIEDVLTQVETGKVVVGQAGEGVINSQAPASARIETPYLQLVMARLWGEESQGWGAGSPDARVLRRNTLRELGGADRIVRTHLDGAMEARTQRERDVAADVFRYLVTPSGTKIAHTVTDLADYADVPADELETVLEALASSDVRVVRPVAPPPDRAGEPRYEIFHDVLAAAVLDWRARHARARAREAQEREREREEEQRQRELADARQLAAARTRAANVLRLFLAVVVLAALGAAAIAVWAVHQKRTADDQRAKAETSQRAMQTARAELANELAKSALAQLRTDASLSRLLARRAVDAAPTPRAVEALRAALIQPMRSIYRVGYLPERTPQCPALGFSSDSTVVTTRGAYCESRVFSVADRKAIPLPGLIPFQAATNEPVSPNGAMIATTRKNGDIVLISRASGKPAFTLRGRRGSVHGIDFTSGGRFLAAAYGDGADVWNLESRERVATIPAARDLTAAAFSPDGTLIAIRGEGIAEVWSWKPLRRLRSVQLHGHVRWAWLSADNRLLVTRDAEQSSVWNVPSGARLPLPQDFRLPVLSPNAKTLVTLTDVPARLWDTRSSRSIAKLRAHGKPTSAAFAPDGSRLAIGTRSGWVALFDASGNRIKLLRPQVESGSAKHPAIAAVAFSPDGRLLAAAAGTWGHVWDVQRLREVEAVPTVSSLFALAFSPNSKLLATQGTDGALRLWDMVGDHLVAQLAQVGLRAATTGFDARGHVLIGGTDGSVRSYSPSTGRPVAKTPAPVRASRVAALGLDGGLAMLVASHGRVRIEYIPGRRIVRTLRVTGTVTKSAFSRDGRMLATAAADGSVRLWGAWSDVLDRVLRLRGPTVTGLSFSDNGALAISDRTGRVVVLDLRAGGARRVVRRSGGSVTAVAFGSDGTLAAALSDHEVLIWRSPGSKKSIELTGTGPVRSVSFSRDGSLLLTTGEEAVGVWGLETKKMLLELPGPAVSAVFDSTGERIVTRDKRGRARLYECTPCGSSTQLANLAQR